MSRAPVLRPRSRARNPSLAGNHRAHRRLPRLGRTLRLVVALAASLSPAFGRAADTARAARPEVRRAVESVSIGRALDGALKKLENPACLGLLSEYKDQSGQSLAQNLATWDRTVTDYLRTTPFRDGSAHAPCRSGKSALFSVVGMRPVFVCPSFKREAERDPWAAEIWLIHEMLHTLGLGENPPSSREITERVSARCR